MRCGDGNKPGATDELPPRDERFSVTGRGSAARERDKAASQAADPDAGLIHDADQFVEGLAGGAAAQSNEDSGRDVDYLPRCVVGISWAVAHENDDRRNTLDRQEIGA